MAQQLCILDIGGEGRYRGAWNLNPSSVRTLGPHRGSPIPRLMLGRGEDIPLPDDSVHIVVVERTPLKVSSLEEIERVRSEKGVVVLRHAVPPGFDPHLLATNMLTGNQFRRQIQRRNFWLQETLFGPNLQFEIDDYNRLANPNLHADVLEQHHRSLD